MEIGSARVTCPTPQQLRGIPPMQQGGGNNHLAVDDFTGGPRELSCHNPGDFNTCGSLPYHHGDMSSGCDSAASSLPLPHHGNEEEWLDISQLSSCGQSYPSSVASLSPSIDSQYGGGGVLYPGDHSNTSFGSQGGYRVPSPDSGFFATGEASLPGAMLHADPTACYTQDPYHHHHTTATSTAAAPVVYAKTWNQGFVPPPFSVGVQKSAAAKRQKRKRVINKTQRTAANHRERKRMVTLNDAFGHLQEKIPKFADDKKISRIETLRVAISYIGFMTDLVNGKTPEVDTQSIERMLSRCNAGL